MTPFTRHTVRAVLLLLTAAVLAYAVGGVMAMLAVMNVMLVVWLSLYLFYMAKLLRWLQSPKLRMAP